MTSRTATTQTKGKNLDFVETLDQKTDITKLWRTIKGIDGRGKRETENGAITLNGSSFSLSKQVAAMFNQQFNTSKLGRHTSSSETRLVTRETKRKTLEMAQIFTTDLVRRAIKTFAGTFWGQQKETLQGSWNIDYQLCCTCLEYKPTRHKLQKHPIYTKRGSEDFHWLSQDVQCRPPTRGS